MLMYDFKLTHIMTVSDDKSIHDECRINEREKLIFFILLQIIPRKLLNHLFQFSSFMNSTLNPLALYFVSSLFRQHFYHLLCCRKHSLERAASFSRGQSVYKKADNKVPVTFIDSSNYSVS